jgi:hypothetical protein
MAMKKNMMMRIMARRWLYKKNLRYKMKFGAKIRPITFDLAK